MKRNEKKRIKIKKRERKKKRKEKGKKQKIKKKRAQKDILVLSSKAKAIHHCKIMQFCMGGWPSIGINGQMAEA